MKILTPIRTAILILLLFPLKLSAEEQADTVPDERKAVTEYAEMLRAQVFPDLRIMLIRAGMLLSYSGLSNEDIKKFFDEVFREYEDRLRVFAFLDYGYASRIEAFVTILYDRLLTVPSLCGTLDGDYPVYNERRDLTPLQRRRLKINDICATQGVRDLLWRTQREVFVLGCSDSHRGDRARYAFGFC